MNQSRSIALTVALVLLFITVIVGGFVYRITQPRVMTDAEMQLNGLFLHSAPRNFGELDLVDHRGEPFTRARFEGQWSLVFFGFTHCPDICPTTMTFLDEFVASLEGTEVEETQVVMVSVDPARDTVEALSTYVPYFNPEFVGVTGEFLDVHRFATALNTPFRKVMLEDGNYTIDHGTNVALVNPRGDYHGFFKSPLDLGKMKVTYRSARVLWDKAY
ncbi:MAG: SCO family protein [Gammaproteobacteria bacterium]|jgi:protein SCO1/2|nr:SCO family protein [Gammaproteobacteria bacterium]